eukprot:gene19532-25430_t
MNQSNRRSSTPTLNEGITYNKLKNNQPPVEKTINQHSNRSTSRDKMSRYIDDTYITTNDSKTISLEKSQSKESMKKKQIPYRNESRRDRRDHERFSEDSWEDGNTCSPASWIYDLGKEAFRPCFHGDSDDDEIDKKPINRSTANIDYMRKFTADSVDFDDDDDDEIIQRHKKVNHIDNTIANTYKKSNTEKTSNLTNDNNSPLSSITTTESMVMARKIETYNSSKIPPIAKQRIKSYSMDNNTEPRIVAPNVSKLSPSSTIDIKLYSYNESIMVQCSVDVLKMRSVYFHELINEQEKSKPHNSTMPNTGNNWREPIVIQENSPFEAAAFLESLHEGRTMLKGEWNLCWARLSVLWMIEDIINEFSNQIETHLNSIITTIQSNNWRTNPNIYAGLKVAVMRKTPSPTPSIIIGLVVEGTQNTGYSKIRVAFDVDKSNNPYSIGSINIHPNTPVNSINNSSPNNIGYKVQSFSASQPQVRFQQIPSPNTSQNSSLINSYNIYNSNNSFHSNIGHSNSNTNNHAVENDINPPKEQIFIGDISEPFWILLDKDNNNLNQSQSISNQWKFFKTSRKSNIMDE